ncbi:MAG: discoidin domain-containing protein [Chloroflexi bacterium]|nr:discoidin domain-containing protein [Chloroflexota bacterium]
MAGSFWVLIPLGVLFVLLRIDRLRLWFLLSAAIWWASLMPVHFESRFYLLLVPFFAGTATFVVTGGLLPDVRFTAEKGKRIRVIPGRILERLGRFLRPSQPPISPVGTSLANLLLLSLLVVTVFATLRQIQESYRWHSDQDDFYHGLAQFVRQIERPALVRPIGTRGWSQAQYWIPSESGVPVLSLAGRDYESVLPKLSYILYDQIDDEDTLANWWDDPKLSALANPLRAPSHLEAVYYKPSPYRAILYRVLEQNEASNIVSTSQSSALPQYPGAQVFDNDDQTWWSSAPQSSENASQSLTLDLGRSTSLNRVWLLPRQGGQAFPAGLRIDVSTDGETWQSVIEAQQVQAPIQQNPQIFPFPETTARFVRITATQLKWDETEKDYLVSLVEARVSLAVERPIELPVFSMSPTDLFYDPLSSALAAKVYNRGKTPGRATVEFSLGWAPRDVQPLGVVESSLVTPGGNAVAYLSSSEWQILMPGDCRPIWATVKPYGELELETYGVVDARPQTVFQVVCSPADALVDDFNYAGSPLTHGWTTPQDQTAPGNVITTDGPERGKQAMRVNTPAGEEFVIRRQMQVYGRSELTLWIKATPEFIIYVRVRDHKGEYYYVQYMPYTWPKYSQEYPDGRYIYCPLGSYFVDGKWNWLERDVYQDFAAKTG